MSSYRTTELIVQEGCITFPAMPKLHPIDQIEVGTRIAVLISALGWQSKRLADAIKISPQKLTNYKKGRNKLPPTHATAICAATGVDFDYLHRGKIDRLPPDLQEKIIKARKAA